VLLAGDYAYKIKKPVELGFLDFRTLAARKRYCDEELRLNRRTAPALYLDVVPITGTAADPFLAGAGLAIEYAVRMRRFAQEDLLDRMARRGALDAPLVDRLARAIAAFHEAAAVAAADSPFAAPQRIAALALDNFDDIERRLGAASPEIARLEALRAWTQAELARLGPVFGERKRAGRVRECHGDLHLGNIARIAGEPVPFDCIEFSDELRWNDVMGELAFLVMDLLDHGLPRLAFRCLDAYLGASGDYAGLAVLRHYLVYRAMVRAKIACIRGDPKEHAEYLSLAERLTRLGRPALVLMQGVAGSGKTTVAQELLEEIGAVRIRSDVERKRLFGMGADAHSASGLGSGIYTEEATRRTYGRLLELAGAVASAGWAAIVDATFLRREERERFRAFSRDRGIPFAVIACEASPEALRERVARREREARDASEAGLAVLEQQLREQEPLGLDELPFSCPPSADALKAALWKN